MFIVLYRWRIDSEKETQFIAAWSEVTAFYRANYDSLGSRLHRGSDGVFYGYAQWKTAEQRDVAFQQTSTLEAFARMREAVTESFPEIRLEVLEDYLILPDAG